MRRELTPEIILEAVADRFYMSVEELKERESQRSKRDTAHAKQVASYLIKMYTDATHLEISGLLGHTDKQYSVHCITAEQEALTAVTEKITVGEIYVSMYKKLVTWDFSAPIKKHEIVSENAGLLF